MKKIDLKRVTGFTNPYNEKIEIYSGESEKRMSPFYVPELEDGKNPVRFNLPAGIYWTNNSITPCRPIIPKVTLPPKERNFKRPSNYDIVFAKNPSKCTIYHKEADGYPANTIVFDESFRDNPMVQLLTIYYHELGHKFYETEKFADAYAMRKMLQDGYNMSQIKNAFIDTLTLDSWDNPQAQENFERVSYYINA